MRVMEEMIACDISFLPLSAVDDSAVEKVLDLISESRLEYITGGFSTVVKGPKRAVFDLVERIYTTMENACAFRLDVRYSNICGLSRITFS